MVIALSESRTVPAPPGQVFDLLFSVGPERVFRRRHGPMPPVREVRAGGGPFAEAGHSRTIVFADGGSVLETLTEVSRRATSATPSPSSRVR